MNKSTKDLQHDLPLLEEMLLELKKLNKLIEDVDSEIENSYVVGQM